MNELKLKDVNQNMSFEDVMSLLANYQEKTKETWASLAQQMDVNATALSASRSGKYQGDTDLIKAKIVDFLGIIAKQEKKKFELQFAETSQILRVLATLRECHENGECGAIWGPAGIGKSTGLRHYKMQYPSQVHILTVYEGITPINVMEGFLSQFGISMGGLENTKMAALIEHIQGKPKLLIIDEAHYLGPRLIEKIRHIYDQTGVPIVFCGNDTVIGQMQGRQKLYFSHVFSRIPNRCAIAATPTKEDIKALCKASQFEFTQDVTNWLHEFAKADGHYRTIYYLLRKAIRMAEEAGEPLKVDHLDLVNEIHYGTKMG